jgi:hypothetical protein
MQWHLQKNTEDLPVRLIAPTDNNNNNNNNNVGSRSGAPGRRHRREEVSRGQPNSK